MDYRLIKQEIQLNPQTYSGKTPEELEVILNEKNILTYEPVSINDVLMWAVGVGAFSSLEAVTPASPLYDAARGFLLLLQGREVFNVGRPQVQDLLTGFVNAEIITETQKQELLQLGARMISRAEQLNLGYVWAGEIAEALAR